MIKIIAILMCVVLGGCMGNPFLEQGRRIDTRVTVNYTHPFFYNNVLDVETNGHVGTPKQVAMGVEYGDFGNSTDGNITDYDFYTSSQTANLDGTFDTNPTLQLNLREPIKIDTMTVIGDNISNIAYPNGRFPVDFDITTNANTENTTEYTSENVNFQGLDANGNIVNRTWSTITNYIWLNEGDTITFTANTAGSYYFVIDVWSYDSDKNPKTQVVTKTYQPGSYTATADEYVIIEWQEDNGISAHVWKNDFEQTVTVATPPIQVRDNDKAKVEIEFPEIEVEFINIEILKWSEGNTPAKLTMFSPAKVRTYDNKKIKNINISSEIERETEAFIGGATASTGQFDILNFDDEFTNHPNLKKNRAIYFEFGIHEGFDNITWNTYGKYYTTEWNMSDDYNKVTVSFTDILGVLSEKYLTEDVVQSTTTNNVGFLVTLLSPIRHIVGDDIRINSFPGAQFPINSTIPQGKSYLEAINMILQIPGFVFTKFVPPDGNSAMFVGTTAPNIRQGFANIPAEEIIYPEVPGQLIFTGYFPSVIQPTFLNIELDNTKYFSFKEKNSLYSDFSTIVVEGIDGNTASSQITTSDPDLGELIIRNELTDYNLSTIALHARQFYEQSHLSDYLKITWLGDLNFFPLSNTKFIIDNPRTGIDYTAIIVGNDLIYDGGLRFESNLKIRTKQ